MSVLFYHNARLLILSIAVIVMAGLAALTALPRLEDPRLNNRLALIVTRFPGASAERVESLVTEKIEEEVREVTEIDFVESSSQAGISVITILLKDEVVQTEEVFSELRDQVADAEALLPEGASKPEFDDSRGATAFTMMAGVTWTSPSPPNRAILGRLAEELERRLRSLAGTELVNVYGEPQEEIIVAVDADEQAALGVSPGQIAQAVARADAKVAAGTVRSARNDMIIEVEGELDSLSRISRVPLAEDGEGGMVRIGDIATVEKSQLDPPRDLAIVSGHDAVVVAARVQPEIRVDLWAEKARSVVDAFRSELPRGVDVEIIFDQSRYTRERLGSLALNFAMGALIVVGVLLFLMGWRSAFMVALSLPLSVSLTLFGMQVIGLPLHQISICGIILSLGLLVDTAIVVVDEMATRMHDGEKPGDAVRSCTRYLFAPLVGSTLTTVIAFMPIVLLNGNMGEFVGGIGKSVVLALLSSFAVSMTIVPALSAHLFAYWPPTDSLRWWSHGYTHREGAHRLRNAILLACRRPMLGILFAAAIPIAGFIASTTLRDQFFPAGDRDQFYIQLRLPQGTSINETRQRAETMRTMLGEYDGIVRVDWFVGNSAPPFYYNMLSTREGVPNYAEALILAKSQSQAYNLVPILQKRFDHEFPDAQVVVRQIQQGPPIDSPVELRIFGPSLDKLREIGDEVKRVLFTCPEILHVHTTLTGGQPKIWVRSSEDDARLGGLRLVDIADQLAASLDGTFGGSVIEGTEGASRPHPIAVGSARGRRGGAVLEPRGRRRLHVDSTGVCRGTATAAGTRNDSTPRRTTLQHDQSVCHGRLAAEGSAEGLLRSSRRFGLPVAARLHDGAGRGRRATKRGHSESTDIRVAPARVDGGDAGSLHEVFPQHGDPRHGGRALGWFRAAGRATFRLSVWLHGPLGNGRLGRRRRQRRHRRAGRSAHSRGFQSRQR